MCWIMGVDTFSLQWDIKGVYPYLSGVGFYNGYIFLIHEYPSFISLEQTTT